ncbi:hypothetical protein SAMN00790413_01253 [Deinococcus hopiensis KR-140]|uniref:Uncharacterized protein n=1 Tax=Deinococcus hopiensis KR-140 TaxID=695939 RepID=A0A1W1VF67_9DEIO|nr:hypothetical protein SAMN00790413_01253 [Deinococcus hopiensis KR-140]
MKLGPAFQGGPLQRMKGGLALRVNSPQNGSGARKAKNLSEQEFSRPQCHEGLANVIFIC